MPLLGDPGRHRQRPSQGDPAGTASSQTYDRVRRDRLDQSGTVTLRVAGKLRHIPTGRTYARTPVILLVQDLEVRVVNAATGELLRELTIDLTRDYQPLGRPPGPTPGKNKGEPPS